ncbi:hypothetical protein ACRALDRAFT_2039198 [Sodiomyces alcalophilus JCM 7366]|uniref:uncharacterized protein n=1 Tax=Sodiomyces alcalophilus JCM 7366 TaxID=591952 RepID=UPI0039B42E31
MTESNDSAGRDPVKIQREAEDKERKIKRKGARDSAECVGEERGQDKQTKSENDLRRMEKRRKRMMSKADKLEEKGKKLLHEADVLRARCRILMKRHTETLEAEKNKAAEDSDGDVVMEAKLVNTETVPEELTKTHVSEAKRKAKGKKAESSKEESQQAEESPEVAPKSVEKDTSREKKKKKTKEKKTRKGEGNSLETPSGQKETPDNKKEQKKKRKSSAEPEVSQPSTKEAGTDDGEQWNVSGLDGGAERQKKFLKLLGGGKKGAGTSTHPQHTTKNKVDISKVNQDLEKQFNAGMQMKWDGGGARRGLGA